MGPSSGVLLKKVVAFRRCPLIEVSLYFTLCTVKRGEYHQGQT